MNKLKKKLICEIGCGECKVFEESFCIDVRRTRVIGLIGDAHKLPFKDECLDYVYSSHVIEHFSHKEINAVLDEWIRVLKKGGVFELRCPDLKTRALLLFLNPSWSNIINVYGEQDYEENYHKSGFTYGILRDLLEGKGIISIRRVLDGYKGIPFIPCDLHIKGIKCSNDHFG